MNLEDTLVALIEEHDFTPASARENEDGSIPAFITRERRLGDVCCVTEVSSQAGDVPGLFLSVVLRVKEDMEKIHLLDEIVYTLNEGGISLPWVLGTWRLYPSKCGLTNLSHDYYWHATAAVLEHLPEWALEDLCVDVIKRMEECSLGVAQVVGEILNAHQANLSADITARIRELADLLEPQGEA